MSTKSFKDKLKDVSQKVSTKVNDFLEKMIQDDFSPEQTTNWQKKYRTDKPAPEIKEDTRLSNDNINDLPEDLIKEMRLALAEAGLEAETTTKEQVIEAAKILSLYDEDLKQLTQKDHDSPIIDVKFTINNDSNNISS